MTTGAVAAIGTLLKIGDGGAPEAFTTVAEVLDATGPSLSANVIDVTNHSTTGNYAEFISGLLDGGEVSFEINYQPADATHDNTTGLLSAWSSRTTTNFQLVFTDSGSTTWSFAGVVTSFNPNWPVEDQLTASVVIKVSGAPTLA